MAIDISISISQVKQGLGHMGSVCPSDTILAEGWNDTKCLLRLLWCPEDFIHACYLEEPGICA